MPSYFFRFRHNTRRQFRSRGCSAYFVGWKITTPAPPATRSHLSAGDICKAKVFVSVNCFGPEFAIAAPPSVRRECRLRIHVGLNTAPFVPGPGGGTWQVGLVLFVTISPFSTCKATLFQYRENFFFCWQRSWHEFLEKFPDGDTDVATCAGNLINALLMPVTK